MLLELLVNRDAAASGTDGKIVYPLSQVLQYTLVGAQERVMAFLDREAEWPLNKLSLASAVSDLALACVGKPEGRPPFARVAFELRNISWQPQVGSSDIPVHRGASALQQPSPSEAMTPERGPFQTILPDSFITPGGYRSTTELEISNQASEAPSLAGLETFAESFVSAFSGATDFLTRFTRSTSQSSSETTFQTLLPDATDKSAQNAQGRASLLETSDTSVPLEQGVTALHTSYVTVARDANNKQKVEQGPFVHATSYTRNDLDTATAIGLRAKLSAQPATLRVNLDRIVGI